MFIVEGQLVPDNIVLRILRDKMANELNTNCGFILDGYPRSISQAESLTSLVCSVNAYIYLQVSDAVLLERLEKRGATSGRKDDNAETVKKRIAVFHSQSRPIVEKFKAQVITIDAGKSIDEVFEAVDKAVAPLVADVPKMVTDE